MSKKRKKRPAAQESERAFAPGAVVQLTGGGPRLTVDHRLCNDTYRVIWFSEFGKLEETDLPVQALQLYQSEMDGTKPGAAIPF